MPGISSLRDKTAAADSAGPASWNGTNGIKAQITDLTDLLEQRGVKVIEDPSLLPVLKGSEAGLVLLVGVALYAYSAKATLTPSPLDVAANGGGRWQFVATVGPAEHPEVIGDSINTVFTVKHGLKTMFPTVLQMKPVNPGAGAPYSYTMDGVVSALDMDTISVTYTTPPGTQEITIVVKK